MIDCLCATLETASGTVTAAYNPPGVYREMERDEGMEREGGGGREEERELYQEAYKMHSRWQLSIIL